MARSALPPTPERIARHVHRRVAVSLTFRRFLSPLDTDPSRRLPRGPAPGCEDPWAAARARRTSPAPCGMRLSPTGVRRPPGLRGTALVLRRRAAVASRRGASRPDASRKGAVCGSHVAQNALFRHVAARGGGAQPPASLRGTMESGPTGQMRSGNPPPGCGGVAPGPAGLGRRARLHGKAQSGQRASLMARPGPGRDTIRLPVVG